MGKGTLLSFSPEPPCPLATPLRLALVGSFGSRGDQGYRLHQSAAALAQRAYQWAYAWAVALDPLGSQPPRP